MTRPPAGPEEVTPEWLTAALRRSGALRRAQVVSVRSEHVGTFSSELFRVHLGYDRVGEADGREPPRTLVAKFPKRDFDLHAADFAAEIEFYEKLGDSVPVRVPRAYFGALDRPARRAALLLEDVPGLLEFHWDADDEHLRLARDDMARLHARYWGRAPEAALPDDAGLGERRGLAARYERGWRSCRELVLEIEPEFAEIGDRLVGRIVSSSAPTGTAATLIHGDAHGENIPLVSPEQGGGVCFLDWAAARWGAASFDVAVFLSMSLPVARRRAVERAFVADHAASVAAAGITGWADAWLDYRRAVLRRAIGIVAIATRMPVDQMAAGFRFVVVRSVKAAVDLSVGDLIVD